MGLTADDPRYEDGSYATESDAVSFVVSCFPPTDMMEAIDAFGNEDDPFRLYYFGPFAAVVGATHETGLSDDVRRRAADMSPYLQVRDGVAYPPTMLLHGTADTVVPYRQSVKMHKEASRTRRGLAAGAGRRRRTRARLLEPAGVRYDLRFHSGAVLR